MKILLAPLQKVSSGTGNWIAVCVAVSAVSFSLGWGFAAEAWKLACVTPF